MIGVLVFLAYNICPLLIVSGSNSLHRINSDSCKIYSRLTFITVTTSESEESRRLFKVKIQLTKWLQFYCLVRGLSILFNILINRPTSSDRPIMFFPQSKNKRHNCCYFYRKYIRCLRNKGLLDPALADHQILFSWHLYSLRVKSLSSLPLRVNHFRSFVYHQNVIFIVNENPFYLLI